MKLYGYYLLLLSQLALYYKREFDKQILVSIYISYMSPTHNNPSFERPPLNPTKIGLTKVVVLQRVSLCSKYNVLNEKCGLSKEVVFQWRALKMRDCCSLQVSVQSNTPKRKLKSLPFFFISLFRVAMGVHRLSFILRNAL